MTELVLAVFDAASAADAAVQDLEVARIPSAVIQRKVSGSTSAQPSVTVAVDEIHAAAVTGILNQYGPLSKSKSAPPTLSSKRGARRFRLRSSPMALSDCSTIMIRSRSMLAVEEVFA
jgi:hypothetical protein